MWALKHSHHIPCILSHCEFYIINIYLILKYLLSANDLFTLKFLFFSHRTPDRRVNSERTRNGNFPSVRNSMQNLKRAEVGQSQWVEQSGISKTHHSQILNNPGCYIGINFCSEKDYSRNPISTFFSIFPRRNVTKDLFKINRKSKKRLAFRKI
ncbi:hypothetical protein PUN28_002054 [Cardiocondyla obscurior]|uniref:Uncharacterized protein n=1 Tax=Cardiocondyla obscurior TaxID=286306 RepID=A0AAW2GSK1_9HYME